MTKKRTKVISIQDLAEAYHSTDYREYQRLIAKSRASKQLKSMLIGNHHDGRFAKNINFQMQTMETIEKAIWQLKDEINLCEVDYEKAYYRVKDAQGKLEAAKRCLEMAQMELESQKKRKSNAQNSKKELEDALFQQTKRLEEMKKFTLVHPTATLSALDKKSYTVIVCTKFDAENIGFRKFADCIIDTDNLDFGVIDIPQDAREKFTSEQEFKSAIQYVKMVIQYWAEDKPYELLYNSEGIRYILNYILR